jgi:hypothetical protein
MRQQTAAAPDHSSIVPTSIKDLLSKTQLGPFDVNASYTSITMDDFGSAIYNFNRFTFNPSNLPGRMPSDLDSLLCSPKKAKKLSKMDPTLEHIIELKRIQDVQKQAKREAGEKRIRCL